MDQLQLELPLLLNRDTLEDYLEKETGRSISLTITENSTSLLSVRAKGNSFSVRLHRLFLHAGHEVIREIAGFIKFRKRKTPLISEFIRQNKNYFKDKVTRSSRPAVIHSQGRYYNVKELFDSINEEYFGGRVTSSITWGKKSPRWAVRKRTLGSYSIHTNTIRINPVLDRKNVPQYFIRFVIYHEMLHSEIPVEKKRGRRFVHTPEFRKCEKKFKDYKKAILWEERH